MTAGEFPYTRGIHPNMYQSRLWTMRQFSGFSLRGLRVNRSAKEVSRTLTTLKRAAERNTDLIFPLLEAVRTYATLGGICAALREVSGTWEERPTV